MGPQVEAFDDGAGERPDCGRRVGRPRTRQGEHRTVMVGVRVHVEERRSARTGQVVDHRAVVPLRHVRHALEHLSSMCGIVL